MNLSAMLQERAAGGRPIRVGLIGAGKFGSMLLAQAQRIPGFHVVGVADLDVGKARASLARVGWPAERYSATGLGDATKTGKTCVLDDASALTACDEIECIVEATGHPIAGVRHGFCQGSCHRPWPKRAPLGIGPASHGRVDEDAVLGMRIGRRDGATRAHHPGLSPVPLPCMWQAV